MSFERVQKPASPTPAPKENIAVSPKDVYLKRKQLDEPSASSALQASAMLGPMTTAQWLQSDLVMKTAQGFESSPAKNSCSPAADRNVSPIGPQSLEQPESDSEEQIQTEQIQTKLTVGAPGDKYEQEADSMAAKVMAMPDSALQQPIQRQTPSRTAAVEPSSLINSIAPLLRRSSGEEEEEEIQMKSGVQRASDGSTQASKSIESRLADSKGGGSPLSEEVRGFMEPRFNADLSGVKVHTNSNAVQMNKELNAQAFTHGSDIYYSEGKSPGKNELTAHELTHTIQQGGAVRMNKEVWRQPQQEEEAETLQAKEIPLARKEQPLFNKETSFKTSGTYNETLAAKELPSHSTTLSHNIISHNKEQLQKTLDREEQETQEEPLQAKQFTNSSPFNNKESIQRQPLAVSSASPRIQGDFLGIGNPIEKITAALAGFASQLPGYSILTLILGKDPISNRPVERTPANLIRALLGLVPNGDKIFNNLQQSGALQKAFSWFNGEIAKLNLTFDAIKTLFGKALSSLGIGDALNPIGAFAKIKNIILEPIGRIKNFAAAAGTKVMELAFEGFLNMAGGAGAKVMGILRQAGGVFGSILKDPVSFCGNLVGALRGGFQKFSGNIATHLKNGLTGWLFGALTGAGLTVPAQLDTKGIVSIVLQVMGATYARLRGKLTNKIGEQKVARLEKAFDFLRTIVTGGLAAAWQKIAEFTGNLQETVIGSIKEWVMSKVITAAIAKLISMFNPAGAIIQAVMAIYNTVMFFVERGSQIAALVEAVFSSIGNIAKGNVAGAANYVEQTMGRSLPVMISFLARLIGLGGVSEQIKNVIKKIQDKVENALNKLANFIVQKGKSLLAGGGGKNRPDTATQSNNNGSKPNNDTNEAERKSGTNVLNDYRVEHKFTMSGEGHRLIAEYRKGNLTLLIASDPELLIPALKDAIKELTAPNSYFEDREKKDCLEIINNALTEAEDVKHDVRRDINEITAKYRTGRDFQAQQKAIEQETKSRLANIANRLQLAAKILGVTALDKINALKNYYKIPPKERYLPIPSDTSPGEFIRAYLYREWATVSHNFSNKEEPKVIQKIKQAQLMPDGGARNRAWQKLKQDGLVERKYVGKIDDYKSDSIKYEVDHKVPLAKLWNQSGQWNSNIAGNDTDDRERYKHMSEPTNLQVVTREFNRSKGSEDEKYLKYVGLNFTSEKNQVLTTGALKFNGQPFRDAAGKPLS